MAAQPAWQYPFAVDSIADANPGLPGYLDRFDTRARKQAEDQFDPAAALQAEATARALHNISNQDPDVTPAVLNGAANRALVLREFHSGVQFPQAANIVALAGHMNMQFGNVGQQLERLAAQTSNNRILAFNRLLPVGMGYRPPVKENPGSGIALAVQLNPPALQLPQQLVVLQANAAAGNPAPPAALGQAPPFYNDNIDAYHHGDVLRLVEFYNDGFGIVVGDGLPTRKQKFRTWMTL